MEYRGYGGGIGGPLESRDGMDPGLPNCLLGKDLINKLTLKTNLNINPDPNPFTTNPNFALGE